MIYSYYLLYSYYIYLQTNRKGMNFLMKITYTITAQDAGQTIHQILQSKLLFSTRLLQKLIQEQHIYLNNTPIDTRMMAIPHEVITADLSSPEDNSHVVPTAMDLSIVYEDEWMLIVNKPAGTPTHPSMLHYQDSLSNGVRYYFDSLQLHKKIRPVNRLDTNTSGLVLFAKCEYIQECLTKQKANGQFTKKYLAFASGLFKQKQGTIELPIGRKEGSIIERCIDFEHGQPSTTHYEVLQEIHQEKENYSLVCYSLETGRTHQIRVHMAYLGHSLLGDTLYGNSTHLINRQALHCYEFSFLHPVTKILYTLTCPLPIEMKQLCNH